MTVLAILGAFWGDEGKGKVALKLTREDDICARYQGGPNAAHTVHLNSSKYIFRMIPAGILGAKYGLLGSGMVLNPSMLLEEIEMVSQIGSNLVGRLVISDRAHIICPKHIEQDSRGNSTSIGTTRMGVGPCYADKIGRTGIRVGDLEKKEVRTNFSPEFRLIVDQLLSRVGRQIVNSQEFVRKHLDLGGRVIAEGAQGALLDIDHGDYPFVTSSNTTIGGVCTGLGVTPLDMEPPLVIASAYMTKVGGGSFPSRVDGELSRFLQEKGDERDNATGLLRECGWIDSASLKWACLINGTKNVVLTKLDVLSGAPKLSVVKCDKQLQIIEGWQQDIAQLRSWGDLPKALLNYVSLIEQEADCRVVAITNGPDNDNYIEREQ